MIVKIKIECDTINELGTHLGVLQNQIIKYAKKEKLDVWKDELPSDANLDDDNCYGSHEVGITN